MKIFYFLFSLLFTNCCLAQSPEYAYRVYFKDKTATQYNLNMPESFLSSRAIDRRVRFLVPVDSSDLPVCQTYIDSVSTLTGGRLHVVSKWKNTAVFLLDDSNSIHLAEHLSFFQKAVLVAIYPNGLQMPDTSFLAQKPTGYDENFYGAAWKQIALCNGQFLHEKGLLGTGILLALIDAGFDGVETIAAFDSLRQQGKIADRWNFAHNQISIANEGSHGTRVLSCIATNMPETFVGTAPGATVALYTSEDLSSEQPIEEDNWVAAAERADSLGADIITTSLGYNTFDPPFPDETYTRLDGKTTFITQGVNLAASKGILLIVSAGNEGLTPWHYILTPGDADSALTIGAVDQNNISVSTSSYGPNASGIRKPDVVALGAQTAVANQYGTIETANGTSFATPIIAGLAACLMQQDSTVTPAYLKTLIRQSADHFSSPDNHIGYGLPDFSLAYNSLTYIDESPTPASLLDFLIVPNPIQKNNLQVQFTKAPTAPLYFSIMDSNGKTLFKKEFSHTKKKKINLKLPSWPGGIYFLLVTSQGKKITKSFLLP